MSETRQAARVGRQILLPRIRSQGKTGIQSVAAVSSTNVWGFSQHDFGQVDVEFLDGMVRRVHFFASRLKYSRYIPQYFG